MATPSPRLYRALGLLLLAGLVLIVLKAAGRLTISWWVATSPIWGTWLLVLATGILMLAVRLLMQTVRRP